MLQALEEQAAAVQHFEWYSRRTNAEKQVQQQKEQELQVEKSAALRQSTVRGLHLELLQAEDDTGGIKQEPSEAQGTGEVTAHRLKVLRDEALLLFAKIDLDKNHLLSHSELRAAFRSGTLQKVHKDSGLRQRLSTNEWKAFFLGIDSDGDGVITEDEFATYYIKQCSESVQADYTRTILAGLLRGADQQTCISEEFVAGKCKTQLLGSDCTAASINHKLPTAEARTLQIDGSTKETLLTNATAEADVSLWMTNIEEQSEMIWGTRGGGSMHGELEADLDSSIEILPRLDLDSLSSLAEDRQDERARMREGLLQRRWMACPTSCVI